MKKAGHWCVSPQPSEPFIAKAQAYVEIEALAKVFVGHAHSSLHFTVIDHTEYPVLVIQYVGGKKHRAQAMFQANLEREESSEVTWVLNHIINAKPRKQ